MKFGWINVFGAAIVGLMLIPNAYAMKNKDEKNLCKNKLMNIIEQAGRYGCIIFMWLPLFVWEFGFNSKLEMIAYMALNAVLILAYWIAFLIYFKKKNIPLAIILAVIPSCIFLISGILLRHWLLVCFAILFAIGHIYVTKKNAEESLK